VLGAGLVQVFDQLLDAVGIVVDPPGDKRLPVSASTIAARPNSFATSMPTATAIDLLALARAGVTHLAPPSAPYIAIET
jgi:hypothetical protein